MKRQNLFLLTLAALAVVACQGNTIPDPEPTTDTVGAGQDGSDSYEWDEETLGQGEEFGSDYTESEELAMVIYFEFDQSEVRPDDQATLERHANRLANDSRASIRLEGHADERGSREYNIGLGERRSQAVRRILLIQGAAAGQISTVSYGEERPAAFGSDEESWALNRRVEIKFIN